MNDAVAVAALAPLLALVESLINGLFGRDLREPLPGVIGKPGGRRRLRAVADRLRGAAGRRADGDATVTLWPYLSARRLRPQPSASPSIGSACC